MLLFMIGIMVNLVWLFVSVFNNGILVCFGKGTAGSTKTFAISFTAIPNIVATLHAGNGSTGILSIYARSNTAFSISEAISDGKRYYEVYYYLAIGY